MDRYLIDLKKTKTYIILFSIIFLLSVMLIPTSYTITGNNSEYYLGESLRLLKGVKLETVVNRPPGFPLMIAGVFKIFGVSIKNANYLVRVFSALNIIIVFLLASELFSPNIGFMSSLFIIFSVPINRAATILNLDPIAPVFILLSIFLFLRQLKNYRLIYSALSGITLGVAYLVKETALLYLPLPLFIILWKKEVEVEYIWKSILIFYISFFVTMSPWMIYQLNQGKEISSLLGAASPEVLDRLFRQRNPISLIFNRDFFRSLLSCYQFYIKPNFTFAPLMVSAWVYVIAVGILRRERNTLVLVLSGILFIPILTYPDIAVDRIGQSITFFDLSFIAVSYFMITSLYYIHNKRVNASSKLTKIHTTIGLLSLVLIISYFAVLKVMNITKNLHEIRNTLTFYVKDKFEVRGRHSALVEEACEWINENVSKREVVYVDGAIWDAFDFFTHMDYEKRRIPTGGIKFDISRGIEGNASSVEDRIIGIWPCLKFMMRSVRYRYIEMFFEGDILRTAQAIKGYHLIISRRNNFIGYYLEKMTGMVPKYKNEQIIIYGATNTNETSKAERMELLTSDAFVEIIPWLKGNYPDDYRRLESFLNRYNLSPDALINSTYTKYQQRWVMKYIPQNSSIAFSSPTGKFIVEEGYNPTFFEDDKPLSFFKDRYEFLFIHNSIRRNNRFPALFKDLEKRTPWVSFPYMVYFGDGWEIYKLDEG